MSWGVCDMTEQIQGIRDAAASFGSRVRRGLSASRVEVMRQREAARTRAAQREALRLAERTAFEDAKVRLDNYLDDMLSDYVPAITQDQINEVTWETPDLVADILEEEIYRIRENLRPVMRKSGFPLETKDARLDEMMDRVWERAHATFHQRAFSHLRLPPYFSFQENGTLNYEPIFWEKQYLYEGYVGRFSRHRYSSDRVLAPVTP